MDWSSCHTQKSQESNIFLPFKLYDQDYSATKYDMSQVRIKVTKRQSVNNLLKCLKSDHGNFVSDIYVRSYAPVE